MDGGPTINQHWCPAKLFVSIFHSFEAGIAHAIPALNDEKY